MKRTLDTWFSCTLLFLFLLQGGAYAAEKPLTTAQASTLIQSILGDAAQQIRTHHGAAAVERLQQKIDRKFNPSQLPAPAAAPPCPAVGFTYGDMGAVIRARPLDQAGVYYAAGNGAFMGMHPAMAKWCFAQAALLAPTCPAYLSNLAFVLNEEGEYEVAVRLLEYANGLDPDEDSIYVNLAYSYQHLKKYEEAMGALLVAVALNPQIPDYRRMLLDLQQMREQEKPVMATSDAESAGASGLKPPQIDKALDLLEERRRQENLDEITSRFAPPPFRGNLGTSRVQSGSRVRPRSFAKADAGRHIAQSSSNCLGLCPNVGLLERLGDEALLGAGFEPQGGDPIGKFQTAGDLLIKHTSKDSTFTKVREFARGGGLVTGMLFYAYAGEISLQCCQTDKANLGYEEAERLIAEMKKESAERAKKYYDELDKPEEFGLPVCIQSLFVSYCVSQGKKGSKRFEISSDSGSIEFNMHPTEIHRYAIKVSHGREIKADITEAAGAGISLKTYTECRFGRGCTTGIDAGASISGGKFLTTSYGTSTSLVKTTFENLPGGSKKHP